VVIECIKELYKAFPREATTLPVESDELRGECLFLLVE
jgi:hypothetical protein